MFGFINKYVLYKNTTLAPITGINTVGMYRSSSPEAINAMGRITLTKLIIKLRTLPNRWRGAKVGR